MTETEWLACTNHLELWNALCGPVSDRKVRLWMVACCRRIWDRLSAEPIRRAVEVAEWYADGLAGEQEREAAAAAVMEWEAASRGVAPDPDGLVFDHSACLVLNAAAAAGNEDLFHFPAFINAIMDPSYNPATAEERIREVAFQATLIRELVGNPFRPVAVDPMWVTPTVWSLAEAAYAERSLPAGTLDCDRLAVLADAFEDAGCTDTAILSHCRGPGPHVRGCFVLDLVLGRR